MMRSVFLATVLGTTAAFGQSDQPARSSHLARNDLVVERTAGFSWFSPGGSWGDVTNRRVYLTSLRRSRLLAGTDRFAIAWVSELVPLAAVQRTGPNSKNCWFNDNGQFVCRIDRSRRVAVGTGVSPVGARIYLNNGGRWRAHATSTFGAMVFSSEMPIEESALLNFTVEYGGGIELNTRAGRSLTAGFKFIHFSNAGMGELNPGLDANVVYLGWTRTQQ